MELIEEIKELKKYKEDNDLTIAELARKIEADDTTVGRWLKGEVKPSFYSLHKVRRFLSDTKTLKELKTLETFSDEVNRDHIQTESDINYLKQRISVLSDIEDLDTLVTELNITTKLGNLMRDAHNTPF
ncbi:helix-turn-helix domain-containing protein [Ligilactobacillus salivarius]|uniref:helix-turn-helix domain-containing protein n=1 Tax=Ligilactobacillus salivarius TaxID=1624 RepID=UPI00136F15AF|nr:helix-turn-helix transcriptional regulator [Ligilactobacillus salivarius]MYV19931.1 helix-turn-helix transcriptional regulator [Ligilactobacillus salivarius]